MTLADEVLSLADALETAYSHLTNDRAPGPPTSVVRRLRELAGLIRAVDKSPGAGLSDSAGNHSPSRNERTNRKTAIAILTAIGPVFGERDIEKVVRILDESMQSESAGSDRRWLVLSLARNVWWCANQAGYTDSIDEAGRYTDAEALAIAERMNDGGDRPVKLVPIYLETPL